MKIYSDDVVTKHDLNEIDVTQTKDIAKLRQLIWSCFVCNLLVSAILGGIIAALR